MKSISFLSAFFAVLSISLEGQQVHFAAPVDISNGTVMGVTSLDVGDLNVDGLVDVAVMEGGAHSQGRNRGYERRWKA